MRHYTPQRFSRKAGCEQFQGERIRVQKARLRVVPGLTWNPEPLQGRPAGRPYQPVRQTLRAGMPTLPGRRREGAALPCYLSGILTCNGHKERW